MASAGNLLEGKYRLTELLGEGSMGAVWKAVHEGLGRPFAVKFLKDYGPSSADMRERFLREARLAAAVHHRSVVDVVDVGTTPEGTPYMVMECLMGETLAQRLVVRPPPLVRELMHIMEQSLLGLDAVHRAGVIHRDLKPENIVLVPDGQGLVPKLVDFGVSREMHRATGDTSLRSNAASTKPGATIGTPLYMAPEQVYSSGLLDGRTDIYAAGVILYEALTGTVPYQHVNIRCLMDLILQGAPVPFAQRRPDLPVALAEVVGCAMSVDPDGRFHTAAEMAARLAAIEPQISTEARCGSQLSPPKTRIAAVATPHTRGIRARQPLGSRRVLLGAGIACALIAVTAAASALSGRHREQQATPLTTIRPAKERRIMDVQIAPPDASAPSAGAAGAPLPATELRARRSARIKPRSADGGGAAGRDPSVPITTTRSAPETFRDPGF